MISYTYEMPPKVRAPKDLAKAKANKSTYSYFLVRSNGDRVKAEAEKHGLSASEIVDEALKYYFDEIVDGKKRD